MSNRPLWNIRRRHEWLATPLKGKRPSRRKRARVGFEQALEHKRPTPTADSAPSG